jgi:2-polyprenyl-3-methyl-5-hydroxy-6-metoxy-1,4-benzoquinol methylase
LLDDPVPLEQDDVTGTVRRRLELAPEDPALYEHAYHGMRFIAHRRDWAEDERVWMGRRWANMAAVGVREGGVTRPSPRALDAGCGSGLLSGLLHQRGYKVDAFDVSRTAIDKAARRFPGVRFVAGELLDCGLDEGAYQLVALSHVIEHVLDDAGFLRSLARFLAPGGRLYLETTWMDLEPLRARPDWVRQRDHYREHTKPGLRALLHAAGYEVLAHEDSWRGGAGEPYQFVLARPASDEVP